MKIDRKLEADQNCLDLIAKVRELDKVNQKETFTPIKRKIMEDYFAFAVELTRLYAEQYQQPELPESERRGISPLPATESNQETGEDQ